MTTKVICDRCDEECKGCGWRVHTWEEALEPQKPSETRDLCTRCAKELELWLGNVPRKTAEAELRTLREAITELARQWEADARTWAKEESDLARNSDVARILRNCARQVCRECVLRQGP